MWPQRRRIGCGLALAMLALATGSAGAAEQGKTGRLSMGRLDISAKAPGLVRISGVSDHALGEWAGTGDLVSTDDVCVWSNMGGYSVTALGGGFIGAFTLDGPGPAALPFSVEFADDAGRQSGTPLQPARPTGGFVTTANATNCADSGPNASVIIRVLESDLAATPFGSYAGTLTLIVAPE